MMALTGIVFSVAFVMVQFSAVTDSPRFATRFARDPLLFHALGVFFATFTYALAATVRVDRDGTGRVPFVSWSFCIALLWASLFVFALLIRRLPDLQIGNTLRFIGDHGRDVIAGTFARAHGAPPADPARAPDAPEGPPTQTLHFEGAPHYVDRLDLSGAHPISTGHPAQREGLGGSLGVRLCRSPSSASKSSPAGSAGGATLPRRRSGWSRRRPGSA